MGKREGRQVRRQVTKSRQGLYSVYEEREQGWVRIGSSYAHKSNATEKMRQLRLADEVVIRENVGARIMASKVFCKI